MLELAHRLWQNVRSQDLLVAKGMRVCRPYLRSYPAMSSDLGVFGYLVYALQDDREMG